MDDLSIKKDVEAELQWEPSVNAAAIAVAVKDGIATLSGRVSSYAEKMAAARAAARVAGVKAVANDLEVSLLPADQHSDEEVARSVANALAWNTSVPADRVKAVVSHDWVTLEGTVEWYYQKEAAEGGTVVQCNDGSWSHAGGISGACSDHSGESTGQASSSSQSPAPNPPAAVPAAAGGPCDGNPCIGDELAAFE